MALSRYLILGSKNMIKGVQVPVDIDSLPTPSFKQIADDSNQEESNHQSWILPKHYFSWQPEPDAYNQAAEGIVPEPEYDMDEDDMAFLKSINDLEDSTHSITELQFESIVTYFDAMCHVSMAKKFQSISNYSIQYDDSVYCEVCKDIYSETDNDMIFCDSCNICVHQSCYGVPKIPSGEWYCSPCKADCFTPVCLLCMQGEGAFKASKHGEWIHVFCALWIPEAGFGNVDKMEPITKIKKIPPSRWSLVCSFCQERVGACIQCSKKDCFVSFHPTCAYQNRCHMMTIYGTPEDTELVKNFTYCLKHSPEQSHESASAIQTIVLHPNRKTSDNPLYDNQCKIIKSLQREFFDHIDILEASTDLNVNVSIIQYIFDFWKEKRMLNGNNPLINLSPLSELVAQASKPEPENSELDPFFKLVSLRQDLERARVLVHMSERRERLKKRMLKSMFSVVEECFKQGKPLPFKLSEVGAPTAPKRTPGKKYEIESSGDENNSLNISQSSLSKVFVSPQKIDVFAFPSKNRHLDHNNEDSNIIVAQEVVLQNEASDHNSDSKNSDKAYNYKSSEDPEWQEENTKARKRRKSQAKIEKMKELATQFSRKITIALSDKSDAATSQDESCHFSTPPTSPEFNTPGFVLPPAKRRKCDSESSNEDDKFVLANTPPSPKRNKENYHKSSNSKGEGTSMRDSGKRVRQPSKRNRQD